MTCRTCGLETGHWRPILGFEQYAVSPDGRVVSLWFRNNQVEKLRETPKQLPYKRRGGSRQYQGVDLWRDGHGYSRLVHRLVLEAFVGPCPPGHEAAHLDGNPKHNCVPNLRWVTHRENMAHAVGHGTVRRGVAHPFAKANPDVVRAIRADREKGVSWGALASRYGMSKGGLRCLANGLTWRDA